MSDAKFKKGDRVRVVRDTAYGATKGQEFTITGIDPFGGGFARGLEGRPSSVWLADLELVEKPASLVVSGVITAGRIAPPRTAEYDDPKHESLIRQVEDLQAVVRRRNEQIGSLEKELKEAHALLEESTVGSALNNTADQLGLSASEVASALELGARMFAQGITADEARAVQLSSMRKAAPDEPIEISALRILQERIGEANAAKGFHEEGRVIRWVQEKMSKYGEGRKAEADANLRNYATARLALITTEVAEAIEEIRNGRAVDETWYKNPPLTAEKLAAVADDLRAGRVTVPKPLKPEGVPSELADIVIRAMDFAEEFGIDLAAAVEEKISYNKTREYRHGKQF